MMNNKSPLIAVVIVLLAAFSTDIEQDQLFSIGKEEIKSKVLSRAHDSHEGRNNNSTYTDFNYLHNEESEALILPKKSYEVGHVIINFRKGRHH